MKSNNKDSPATKFRSSIRKRKSVGLIVVALFALNGAGLLGQQQATLCDSIFDLDRRECAGRNPTARLQNRRLPPTLRTSWVHSTFRSIGAFERKRGTFFEPSKGQNTYAFEHSLLRIGIGQKDRSVRMAARGRGGWHL